MSLLLRNVPKASTSLQDVNVPALGLIRNVYNLRAGIFYVPNVSALQHKHKFRNVVKKRLQS